MGFVEDYHPYINLVLLVLILDWKSFELLLVKGNLDKRSHLQTGQKLLISSTFCLHNTLRQVTFQRHLSQIRNILSFSSKFFSLFTIILVEAKP